MRKMSWVVVLAGLVFSGCADVVERELEVAPVAIGCHGVGPMMCLQVREPGQADYQFMYFRPRGFEFEWGFEYRILVEERTLDPASVPADGASTEQTLEAVISATPVPAGTVVQSRANGSILRQVGTGAFEVASEPVLLECAQGVDCDALAALLSPDAYEVEIVFSLRFTDGPSGAVEIVDWQECPLEEWPC